jgi:hypothetical protein
MGSVRSGIRKGLHWISPSAAYAARRVLSRMNTPWNKAHIINRLSERRAYRHYLELCTPTSGGRYAEIDHSKFATCIRLMYNCPDSYLPSDGLTIDYRTPGLDIDECMTRMREDGRIALIDSFHEYECSLRDLVEGFRLITTGGTLVVHDCLPPKVELAQPKFIPGEWCGVTYQAFIDFVSCGGDLKFYTVNTDYGCGVIHKLPQAKPRTSQSRADALADWQARRGDSRAAFFSFREHEQTLMNTISVQKFRAMNPKPLSALWYDTRALWHEISEVDGSAAAPS